MRFQPLMFVACVNRECKHNERCILSDTLDTFGCNYFIPTVQMFSKIRAGCTSFEAEEKSP